MIPPHPPSQTTIHCSSLFIPFKGTIKAHRSQLRGRVFELFPVLNICSLMRHHAETPQYTVSAKSLQSCPIFCDPWTAALGAPLSMGFPSKHTGVGCHFLLQGIFPTQGSNPCLLVSCVNTTSATTVGQKRKQQQQKKL